jgi:hypothetical protein
MCLQGEACAVLSSHCVDYEGGHWRCVFPRGGGGGLWRARQRCWVPSQQLQPLQPLCMREREGVVHKQVNSIVPVTAAVPLHLSLSP